MKVIRTSDHKSRHGTTFTGKVTLESVLDAQTEGGISVSIVHFENGARTTWRSTIAGCPAYWYASGSSPYSQT